jgi:hypothetical protein
MMLEFVWVDGLRQSVSQEMWDETASTFFGLGYRTILPVVKEIQEPVNFHRNLAAQVANALGRPFDKAPWEFIESGNVPVGSAVEVVGSWPTNPDQPNDSALCMAWSAISPVAPAPHDAAYLSGVSLPWSYNSASPLSGLPTLSRLEESQAIRHLENVGAGVGLWWNNNGYLAGSTHGAPLVQIGKRSWVFPDRGSGMVSNWVFFNVASLLGATPSLLTREMLTDGGAVVFIDGSGSATALDSLDGEPLELDKDVVLTLLTTSLGLLG